MFFLAGLYLYLLYRDNVAAITCVAGIFVIAGCIKHNPVDFPIAVLIDLLLKSKRRALWFAVNIAGFAGIAVALNIHYGGPFFLRELLAPRHFSAAKSLDESIAVLGPLFIPLCIAGAVASRIIKNPEKRVIAVFFIVSILVGGCFGGGEGVTINAQFSTLLAVAMLTGLFFDVLASANLDWRGIRAAQCGPALLFAWLVIPAIVWGVWNPIRCIRQTEAFERQFDRDVAFLRKEDGPILCESMLRCYFAGKPYLYDPFNATRLVEFGKLNVQVPVAALRNREFAAVELEDSVKNEYGGERFNSKILDVIQSNYIPVLVQPTSVILVPEGKRVQWSYDSAAMLSTQRKQGNVAHVRDGLPPTLVLNR
jgi:hypothetical protein